MLVAKKSNVELSIEGETNEVCAFVMAWQQFMWPGWMEIVVSTEDKNSPASVKAGESVVELCRKGKVNFTANESVTNKAFSKAVQFCSRIGIEVEMTEVRHYANCLSGEE